MPYFTIIYLLLMLFVSKHMGGHFLLGHPVDLSYFDLFAFVILSTAWYVYEHRLFITLPISVLLKQLVCKLSSSIVKYGSGSWLSRNGHKCLYVFVSVSSLGDSYVCFSWAWGCVVFNVLVCAWVNSTVIIFDDL